MGAGSHWPEFRNGWSGIAEKLVATRQVWPDNPMIVSELWSGWFDDWGKSRHNGKTPAALDWKLHELLAIGAAGYSHWMWGGGTHFAYWGGRTVGGDTVHMATTYDYDAPIGEYGSLNEKFYVARRHHLLQATLGSQLSRLLADAANGGPQVIAPKAVPGRAAGGSDPWRNVHSGSFSATFLQNPTLERQAHQLFLPPIDGAPAAHLTVEVEAGTLKPIFAGLPLGDTGLMLRLHTSRLLGLWSAPAGDTLVLYGFEGEVGRLELMGNRPWTVLDPDRCSVDAADNQLAVRYWIGDRPTVVRVLAGDWPLSIFLLTQARAERWWPLGDHGFLCGPDLVVEDGVAADAARVDTHGCYPYWHFSADGEVPPTSLRAHRNAITQLSASQPGCLGAPDAARTRCRRRLAADRAS